MPDDTLDTVEAGSRIDANADGTGGRDSVRLASVTIEVIGIGRTIASHGGIIPSNHIGGV